MKSKYSFKCVLLALCLLYSCKKFVQVPPPATSLVSANVYTNDATASSVLLGIYTNMMTNSISFANTMDQYTGLQADELTNYNTGALYQQFYTNSLNSSNVPFWTELYNEIFAVNSVMEGINRSTGLTPAVQQQLIGEAKFMRAFYYFYLVNLWGDVPLITSAQDYQSNNVAPRTSSKLVYQQIIADLIDAQNLLSGQFVGADALTVTTERTRPTKWAATALLARVYLYTGDYQNAKLHATAVINNTGLFSLVNDLSQVFLKNSQEAIWQLQPTAVGYDTFQAYNYILTTPPGTGTAYFTMSPYLLNAFETGDNRKTQWVGSYVSGSQTYYYPFKYKANKASAVTEYLMVLRLGEQYLIRAEAEANLTDIQDAATDLNVIRNRAGLPPSTMLTPASTLAQAETAILHERQLELFSEWGHRWLDLKRADGILASPVNLNTVMGTPGNVCQTKGGNWNSNWQLYPLPLNDIKIDQQLTQNPGY